MSRMLRLLLPALLLAVAAVMPGTPRAMAAELVMFDDEACPWCIRFKEEVGRIYANTPEGKAAPLKIIDAAEVPKEYEHLEPIIYTPTFVLLDDEKHIIGRIEGYPGYDFFWLRLGKLLEKLKEHKARKAAQQKPAEARAEPRG